MQCRCLQPLTYQDRIVLSAMMIVTLNSLAQLFPLLQTVVVSGKSKSTRLQSCTNLANLNMKCMIHFRQVVYAAIDPTRIVS